MGQKKQTFKTPLGIVKGLGAAHHGSSHWLMQRFSALGLVLFGLWFIYAFLTQVPAVYGDVLAWIQHPLHMAALGVTIALLLFHSLLGLQIIIEDYVHCAFVKLCAIYGLYGAGLILWVTTMITFIKIQSIPLSS